MNFNVVMTWNLSPGNGRDGVANLMGVVSATMEKSIDELLSDETPAEEVVDTSEHVTTTLDQPRDESGRFAPKETGVETPQPEQVAETVSPTVQGGLDPEEYKVAKAERERRQAAERELEALRKQIEAQQNPPAPPPSVWEDEQAYGGHIVSQAVQQATFNARLDMSEMMVRQSAPDFEDMKSRFLQMAEMNPALRQQALADPHPWNKAYQIAKNAATMEELGATDIETLRAKIREEELAKLQQPVASRPAIPPSLTNERNVGSRSGPAWTGPKPLSELLG